MFYFPEICNSCWGLLLIFKLKWDDILIEINLQFQINEFIICEWQFRIFYKCESVKIAEVT